METMSQEKPRLKYSPEHFAARKRLGYPEGTIAAVIERFINEMDGIDGKRPVEPLGGSHKYTLRRLQRQPIGAVIAEKLTEDDLIDHCKARIEYVKPSTINQDVGYLHGALKYAKAAWRDCKPIPAHVIPDVRPFLEKNGYIGKSIPRTRVPMGDEIPILMERLSRPPLTKHKSTINRMPDIIAFALVASRRIGEIMRIERADVDWEHKDEAGNPAPLYHVRKMKHPKKKDYSKWFPLYPELAEILLRQPVKLGDDRFFPFNAKSVGAKYTRTKKELRAEYPGLFIDLRFHDNRRKAITEWLRKFTPHQVRHFISGHESVKMIESNYDATDPADGHAVLRGQQPAAAGSPA